MSAFRTTMLMAGLTALFMGVGYTFGGGAGALIALAVAAGMNLFTFWNADRIVLNMHDAREVDILACPEFVGLVHDLAARAGLPAPRVYVIDSPHPNAFATGRDPHHAAVAATTGLLGLLTRDEIAGVMAHELGHIRNRDTLVMTMTATIAGAIAMLASFGMFLPHGEGQRPQNLLASLAAMLLAPFAAMIVQMAISRTREYGADQAGAEISGKPRALASALAKLAERAAQVPNPVVARNPAAAALYIVPSRGGGRDDMFSTHPDTANRIAALDAMAASMGPPAAAATVPRVRRHATAARTSALDPLGRR